VDVLRPQKDEEWGARTFDLFDPSGLGYHLKTGHTLSLQNRPTELTQNKSSYTS